MNINIDDVMEQDLIYAYYPGQWTLDRKGSPIYNIMAARTIDGMVLQEEIDSIADDGDCFNLEVRGQTRHAGYLMCVAI